MEDQRDRDMISIPVTRAPSEAQEPTTVKVATRMEEETVSDDGMSYNEALLTLVRHEMNGAESVLSEGARASRRDRERAFQKVAQVCLSRSVQHSAHAAGEARADGTDASHELGHDAAMADFEPVRRQVMEGIRWLLSAGVEEPPEPFREEG